MKILVVHNFYKIKGGEYSVFNNEVNLLKENGHEIITFNKDNHNISGFLSKINILINVVYSKKIFKEFDLLLKKEKPEIIHVHNFFPQITPSIFYAAEINHIPIIQTLHNYRLICPSATLMFKNKIYEKSIIRGPFSTIIDKVYKNSYLGTFALSMMIAYHNKVGTWNNKVNRFISLTEFSKSIFIKAGFLEAKIKVKPNFVFDIKEENLVKKKYALYVGRLSEEKGIKNLLQAWDSIDYLLIIAGSGPLSDFVKRKTNEKISYIGNQSEKQISTLMNEASFLIIPSIWYEGFPMVILEAFSSGTPVLGSRIGSIEEVIKDGITGLHFNPYNTKDLIDKINTIISDKRLLKKLGLNARKEYLRKFTPEKNFKELMNLYNEVLNEITKRN